MRESNTQTNNPLDPVPEPEPLSVELATHHSLAVRESTILELTKTILHDYDWNQGEISIAIVNDSTIHRLNREYLQHDFETDVLSFVLESDATTRTISGEIIVSADTASTAAHEHNISPQDELLLYIIHGTLHLAGLDDKDPVSRKKMREAEMFYTQKFGIEYRAPDNASDDGGSV